MRYILMIRVVLGLTILYIVVAAVFAAIRSA
jgi:hypothetical protein